ncbi:nucleotidyltransferase family protein [Achromobacter sp.]|uniref:nucleotidyltransferase family protein n=1 Tax=Achromobacter sp. TaxID=134375 RepID=UPI0031D5E8E2
MVMADAARMCALEAVRDLDLTDCWIGAGFVRNLVWDSLAGFASPTPLNDVDVVWFGDGAESYADDIQLERRLGSIAPGYPWSVKNQAHMYRRNHDRPYLSTIDALTQWPETATAVAVRLDSDGRIQVLSPYGLDDLFAGVIRMTPRFKIEKRSILDERWQAKQWHLRWPFLRYA